MKSSKFLLTCLTCATVLSSGFTANAMVVNNNTRGGGEIGTPGSSTMGRGLTDSRLGDLSRGYSFGNNYETSRSMGIDNSGIGSYRNSNTFNNFNNRQSTSDMNYRGFTDSNANYYDNANIPSVAAYPNTPSNLGTAVNTDNRVNGMYGIADNNRTGTTGYRSSTDNYPGSANYPSPSYRNGDLGNTDENYDYYNGGSSIYRTSPRHATRNAAGMGNRMRTSNIDRARTDIGGTENTNMTIRRGTTTNRNNANMKTRRTTTSRNMTTNRGTTVNRNNANMTTRGTTANRNMTTNKGITTTQNKTKMQVPIRNQSATAKSGLQTQVQTQNKNNSLNKSAVTTKSNTAQNKSVTKTQPTTTKAQNNQATTNTVKAQKSAVNTTTTKSATQQNKVNTKNATARTNNNTAMTNRTTVNNTTRTQRSVPNNNTAMTDRTTTNNMNNGMARNNNYYFRNRDNISGYDYNIDNNGYNYRGGYRNDSGYAMDRYGDDYRNTDGYRYSGYRMNRFGDYERGGYRDNMLNDSVGNYRANKDGYAYGTSGFRADTTNKIDRTDKADTINRTNRTNTAKKNNTTIKKNNETTNKTTAPAATKTKNTTAKNATTMRTTNPRFDSTRNTTTRAATNRAVRYRDTVTESRNATITFVILLVAIAALLALAIYALMRPRYDKVSDNDSANRRR